jgi:hypothetical protein
MIRFLPDTWRDALLRPLAMASPDAGVYVEVTAPDLRFAAILLFALILALMSRRWPRSMTPMAALSLWLLVAFAVWLATSGNGRYFMPGLLIAGPICIGLVARLPVTRSLRATLAGGVVLLQGLVIWQNTPWGWWGLAPWDDRPFFETVLDEQARTEPATYVTISNISYSLIAPLFAEQSRWVNASALPEVTQSNADSRRFQALLAASAQIKLVVPTRPEYMTSDLMPSAALRTVIDDSLVGQQLALASPLKCRMQPSPGMARGALKLEALARPELVAKFGFWICDLRYPVPLRARDERNDPAVNAVFDLVEKQCPRFYASGQTNAGRIEGGWVRMYPQSDLRLYVMDDGHVYYKYWRALNPMLIGTVDQLRAGARVECTIRGRTGLPWEREI